MDRTKTRVFVVDDHPAICDSLREEMTQHESFEYAGRASDETQLLDRLHSNIDLLVLDLVVELHDLSNLLKEILKKHPGLRIVIFTGKEDFSIVYQSLQAGATGFLSKTLEMKEVCDALARVRDGKIVVELGKFTRPDEEEEYQALQSLTKSEKQVLLLLCQGFDKDEIAAFLTRIKNKEIKPATVAKHQTNIRKALEPYGMGTDFSIGYKVAELKPFDGSELSEDFED